MATQISLKGGFYGKLGDMVGQRWKDKAFVRKYVIPFNPQTAIQQDNRRRFGFATQLAQEAMNINGHTDAYDITKVPEFSQRVGQAMNMLKIGGRPDQAFPLYPSTYTGWQDVTFTAQSVNISLYQCTINTTGLAAAGATSADCILYTPWDMTDGVCEQIKPQVTISGDDILLTVSGREDVIHSIDQRIYTPLFYFYDAAGKIIPNIKINTNIANLNPISYFDYYSGVAAGAPQLSIYYRANSKIVSVIIPLGEYPFRMYAAAMRVSDIVLPSGPVSDVFYSAPQYANVSSLSLNVGVGGLGADPVSFSVELVCNTVASPTNKAYYNKFAYTVQ